MNQVVGGVQIGSTVRGQGQGFDGPSQTFGQIFFGDSGEKLPSSEGK